MTTNPITYANFAPDKLECEEFISFNGAALA